MNKQTKNKYRKKADEILNYGYDHEKVNDLYNLIYEILGEC